MPSKIYALQTYNMAANETMGESHEFGWENLIFDKFVRYFAVF
jgi:hypothetical protein